MKVRCIPGCSHVGAPKHTALDEHDSIRTVGSDEDGALEGRYDGAQLDAKEEEGAFEGAQLGTYELLPPEFEELAASGETQIYAVAICTLSTYVKVHEEKFA